MGKERHSWKTIPTLGVSIPEVRRQTLGGERLRLFLLWYLTTAVRLLLLLLLLFPNEVVLSEANIQRYAHYKRTYFIKPEFAADMEEQTATGFVPDGWVCPI